MNGGKDTDVAVSAENDKVRNGRTDQNDSYSLKVRAEYVLKERPSSLGELPDRILEKEAVEDSNKRGKKGKHNKKRPRDARALNSEKVCLAVLRGDRCPYGDTCKFSHDLKTYLDARESDITTVDGGCPNFSEKGYCVFGAMCRFGSSHLIKSTGENLRKEGVEAPPPIQNILSKEVLMQLRKKTYPFKTKRFDGKKNRDEQRDADINAKSEENLQSSDKNEEPAEDAGLMHKDTTKATISEEKVVGDILRPSLTSIGDALRPLWNAKGFNSTPIPKSKKIIDFRNKVYVAPLTTVGNLPFRRIMKKFGADITCGEMAVVSNLLEGKPSEWALLKRHPEEDVFGVQIASGYADQFTRICEVIEEEMNVDFVDLNLGCPLDIICNKGAGSALMMREKRLKSSLEGITKVLSCPVTVKMRTGWDMEKPIAHKLVPKIQSWGIDGIAAVMVSSLIFI